jgi:protein subunit release factor B
MPVSTKKRSDLKARMRKLGIHERDLEEKFIRASGPGGQNVNKVSTCVVLRHPPSGTEVRCQTERTQALNRFLARRRLTEKIEKALLGRASAAEKRRWKAVKQKRRRSKKAKEKVLELKRRRSEKKLGRRPVKPDEE